MLLSRLSYWPTINNSRHKHTQLPYQDKFAWSPSQSRIARSVHLPGFILRLRVVPLSLLTLLVSVGIPALFFLTVTSPASVPAIRPHGGLFCLIDASFKVEGLRLLNCGLSSRLDKVLTPNKPGLYFCFCFLFVVLSLLFLGGPLRYCKNDTHVLLRSHES